MGTWSPKKPFMVSLKPKRLWRRWRSVCSVWFETSFFISLISFEILHCLSASWDNTLRLWDLSSGQELNYYLSHLAPNCWATLSTDHQHILGADPEAWRYLGWLAQLPNGRWERFPIEAAGPLPLYRIHQRPAQT